MTEPVPTPEPAPRPPEVPVSTDAGPVAQVSFLGSEPVHLGPAHHRIAARASEVGIRRVHVLAWRDLDDIEAGGSEVHASMVARHWAAAGLWVSMRTSFAQGRPQQVWRDGYLVTRKAGRYLVFPRSVASALARRSGPRDALVEIWNGMPFFSPLWDLGPRIVLVHHLHADMWRMALPPTLATVGDTIERRLAPPLYRRSRVVTLSPSSRDELVERMGLRADRVTVVPPGVADHFRPGPGRSATPLVVGVGRLVPVKRFELLIDAVAAVRRHRADVRLVIVGDGHEREALEERIRRLDAHDWVELRGRVDDSTLVELYRRAWVVASTSLREGWGMTLTEAAACATPAVATRIAGHLDAVTDGVTGLLADPGDELVEALRTLLDDDERRAKMGAAALERAERLRWDGTAEAIFSVLADEAARRRR